MAAFLLSAFDEDTVGGESRQILRLHPRLAPYKVAVLPLSKNERLSPVAREVAAALRPVFQIDYDEAGAIGRRYRRHDEIGTPWCVTIDGETLSDDTVTLRDRDSLEQTRVKADELPDHFRDSVANLGFDLELGDLPLDEVKFSETEAGKRKAVSAAAKSRRKERRGERRSRRRS